MYKLGITAYILIFLVAGADVVVANPLHPLPKEPAARHEAKRLAHVRPVTRIGHIDYSGRSQRGQASYYARGFAGHKTAGGKRFYLNSNGAASKTLPLGSTARVTNLTTNRSARVKIEDRGPYAKGRLLDVAPQVADRLGLKKSGVAPVIVAPITVPQPDGTVKLGAGAARSEAVARAGRGRLLRLSRRADEQ